jgi:CopA family copper-resistance protein
MFSRRHILTGLGGAGFAAAGVLPAWAQSSEHGAHGLTPSAGAHFTLDVAETPVRIGGRAGRAITMNGTLPAPLLRFRQGETITLDVTNHLEEDTSVHWHGLLVPFQMDGVPGVAFPGIKPHSTFRYEFAVPQNGTYWFHSHSGLQEQLGHYGPIIIDPAGPDPVAYDREYVLMLADWNFGDPHRLFTQLKSMNHTFDMNPRTFGDFLADVRRRGLGATVADRAAWGQMRMSATDISDITGATYTYLINGHSTADNWNGAFEPGQRVRLRIINASAMTLFNVRMPGLPMTVVASDGLNIQPIETDEFQIGVAETYDVIIQPEEARAYAFVAEAIDRSGMAVATFGPRPGMRAAAPPLRERPILTLRDMGHGEMGAMDEMPDGAADHSAMGHDDHAAATGVRTGPGVDMLAMNTPSRLDEPGIGLENVPHRTLRYAQLRSLEPNLDTRPPGREIEVHLTGNMERYMWSFDGLKFSEITAPIVFNEGERVRLTMVNDTMMSHPIHLHGMFFDLVNGGGDYMPRKHTVVVKPAERLSVDITADAVGDWAFHCHLLFHMHAGMMQVVSVLPSDAMSIEPSQVDHSQMDHGGSPPPGGGEHAEHGEAH